jgi:molybdate transport system substrate-binding protein
MKRVDIVAIAFASLFACGTSNAEDIKVLSSVGVKLALDKLAPEFEKASEHKLKITYGTAVPLKRQIDAGESFDVVILTPAMIDELSKAGKVAPGTSANVAKIGIGVAIKAGAPKPDIGSVDALKRTLLNAKSISYSKEGQSGTAMASIIERLGLTDQLKDRTVLETRSGQTAATTVEGKAELAFTLISEILPIAGAELAGPLPPDIQTYVVFTAGISSGLKDSAAAKNFIGFFKSPAAIPVLKNSGMEPG